MRRSLVLGDETARHPFLASLPPHVRAGAKPQTNVRKWALNAQDARDFMLAFCACFLAASTFFA